MEALSDPRAFLLAQEEKRAAQLKNYDIEDEDYDPANVVQGSGMNKKKLTSSATPSVIPGVTTKKAEERGTSNDINTTC